MARLVIDSLSITDLLFEKLGLSVRKQIQFLFNFTNSPLKMDHTRYPQESKLFFNKLHLFYKVSLHHKPGKADPHIKARFSDWSYQWAESALNLFIFKQDYCKESRAWPPLLGS